MIIAHFNSLSQSQKEKTFKDFYRKQKPVFIRRNWSALCKFLTEKDDKLDIFQDVMEAFYKILIGTGFVINNPIGLFTTMAKRRISNWCRKKAHEYKHGAYIVETWAEDEEPEKNYLSQDFADSALAILKKEYPFYAQLLYWRFIVELDYDEIQQLDTMQNGKERTKHNLAVQMGLAKKKLSEIVLHL